MSIENSKGGLFFSVERNKPLKLSLFCKLQAAICIKGE
jgi:hypothetical protein